MNTDNKSRELSEFPADVQMLLKSGYDVEVRRTPDGKAKVFRVKRELVVSKK